MDVPDLGLPVAEGQIQRRIVDVVLEPFVETDDDIDLRATIRGREIAGQRARGDGELLHPAFHEVSRRRRFGEHHEIGFGIELRGLADNGADASDVVGVLAFGGPEL